MTHPAFAQWRSPPPAQTPALKDAELPVFSPQTDNAHLHPSFLPPCEHGKGDDMHAHAFDLLSLSGPAPASTAVPSSVPAHPTSFLSATRPPTSSAVAPGTNGSPAAAGANNGSVPKARRMSSSTTGVLGRGKLGLMGDNVGLGLKDSRLSAPHAASFSGTAPVLSRRPTVSGPAPPLFDFAKTDRRPSVARPAATRAPASLPARSGYVHSPAQAQVHAPTLGGVAERPVDDMELDMAFGDDDEGERSGSAEREMEMDGEDEAGKDWEKLALGTGSGGVKGRRKGMVFKCESCAKEYRHPSCLVKHRWEHSPHWREPTQISMSKHQQVQMLEAAAILAHLDPTQPGRSLPSDKSLWPAILSPSNSSDALPAVSPAPGQSRRLSGRAPFTPSSFTTPLLPSMTKERKSSPGTDSTSSMTSDVEHKPGIPLAGRAGGASSIASSLPSLPQPGTPQSIGSLPDMAGLHFVNPAVAPGTSPIPHRLSVGGGGGNGVYGSSLSYAHVHAHTHAHAHGSFGTTGGTPLSLSSRIGMIGGGMFGKTVRTEVPSSNVRGGPADADDDDDLDLAGPRRGMGIAAAAAAARRKDEDGEEWGVAMDMEL
ncbi:hypothetical protein Q5752_003026 [Cryptotrichosporon argae]